MTERPLLAVLAAAALFGASTPLAKLLLGELHPIALAGLLYAGAFLGLAAYRFAERIFLRSEHGAERGGEAPLGRNDLGWLAGAVLAGGIAAPILLMLGLARTSGFAASLLLNFEAAATAVLAVAFFGEHAGRTVCGALALMTVGGALLSWSPGGGRLEPLGPLLVLAAMFGWGLDNNLTRRISGKDPVAIAMIKGLVSGAVSLALAFGLGRGFEAGPAAAAGLVVGAFGYGLSLVLFIRGLKGLGALRTGALFGLAPFVGALVSVLVLRDRVGGSTAAAGLLMAGAAVLIAREKHVHAHPHPRVVHTHAHAHDDLHHLHGHGEDVGGAHVHEHVHPEMDHVHGHRPDGEHRHGH
jgi:drug/metabolite transporter (DMT)-like permease